VESNLVLETTTKPLEFLNFEEIPIRNFSFLQLPNGSSLIFGGKLNNVCFSNIYLLNFNSKPLKVRTNLPPRYSASFAYTLTENLLKLFVVGGFCENKFEDLWIAENSFEFHNVTKKIRILSEILSSFRYKNFTRHIYKKREEKFFDFGIPRVFTFQNSW